MKKGTTEFYSGNIFHLQQQVALLAKKQDAFYWIRLLTFLFFASALGYGVYCSSFFYVLGGIVSFALFGYAVYADVALARKRRFLDAKISVNQKELDCLAYSFTQFHDGDEYAGLDQHLVADFQLFGKGSLYQFVSRCNTVLGRRQFATSLVQPLCDIEAIKDKQIAIKELADKFEFRQDFQAHGMNVDEAGNELDRLVHWLAQPAISIWKMRGLALFATAVNGAVLVLVALGILSVSSIGLGLAAGLWAVYSQKKIVDRAHDSLGKTSALFLKYSALFELAERVDFQSPVLVGIQSKLEHQGHRASEQIASLQSILNRFDLRYNVFVSIFINAYTGFDLLVLVALERWKNANSAYVKQWFEALSELDSLQSFGTLTFNTGDGWCFPKPQEHVFCIKGTAIGHPLIADDKRVCNSFDMQGRPSVRIITGANMAGKSTFMRTIACNMILAMNGAPVCAEQFRFTPVEILSSIKIEDSLLRNESYFYAELHRLQSIITRVGEQPKSLVILDEIMRGTNSKDKQVGTRGLVEKLIATQAPVIIATHDLSIGELEQSYPECVANYCFEVELNGNELYFDYTLKRGISTKLNASFLMQKMGIL